MSEEEKQAIEILKQEPDYSLSYYKREKAIDIVLNLIEKQQEEIKYLKGQIPQDKIFYYSEKDYISKDKIIEKIQELEKQQKEIEELKDLYSDEKIRNTIIKRYREVIEKDYISKDKIKEILNKYGKKDIGYAVNFYKEIEKLLEE